MKQPNGDLRPGQTRGLVRCLRYPLAAVAILIGGGMLFPSNQVAPRGRHRCASRPPMEVVRDLGTARPAPSSSRSLRYAWEPGTLLRYDFSFQQEMGLSMKAELLAEAAKHGGTSREQRGAEGCMSIDAQLLVHVYEAKEGEALVGYRLESPSVDFACSGQSVTPDARAEMGKRLAQEVLVQVSPRGEALELRFAPETAARERNLMRSLLALVRIVLAEGNEREWRTREEDSLGTFEGLYSASAPDADGAVRIRKAQRYLEVHGDGADPRQEGTTKATMEGEVVGTFAARAGVLVEVAGKVTSDLEGKDLASHCHASLTVSLRLAAIERGAVDPAWRRSFEAWSGGGLGRERADAAEQRMLAERKAQESRKVSLDQLLASLDEACRSGDFGNAGQQVGLRLAALFQGDEGAVASVLALVRDPRGHERGAVSTLIFALARAGTPSAQDALLSIVRGSEVPPEHRHEAVLAAVEVASPRPELLEGLERQLDAGRGLSDPTTLALLEGTGIASFQAASRGDQERAEAMVERLQRELAASSDPPRARAALVGLGNAAMERSLPSIEGRLRDEDESVREAAVGALGRMPVSQARPLLERVGREDSSERVRAAAARVLGEMMHTR